MNHFSPLLILFVVPFLFSCNNSNEITSQKEHILWYAEAASDWEEALPLGNGRLGAMVFGNPTKERIQLNDDSLWPKDFV